MVVLIQASDLRENQMIVLNKHLVQDKIKLLRKVSIWLNSGSNGCVQYHLAQNWSNGCVTTRITHWHTRGEKGKLGSLQHAAASVDSMQFAWFIVDHNSAVFGQLNRITISVLFELKLRKLNSETNSIWNSSIGVWYIIPHSTPTRFLLAVQQL